MLLNSPINMPYTHNPSQYRKKIIIGLLTVVLQFVLTPGPSANAQSTNVDNVSYRDLAIGASGLVLQPIYLAIKLAIGVTGTVLSGGTLLLSGSDEEAAKEVFDRSWAGPWGMPELFKEMEATP